MSEKQELKEFGDKVRSGEFSLTDFVKTKYPPPKEGDPDYSFYKQWGYDQYLIKTQQQNLKAMKMWLRPQYNHLKMLSIVELNEDGSIDLESLKGLPIIRTTRTIKQLFLNTVAKGWIGVRLWEDEEGHFCMVQGTRDTVVRYMEEGKEFEFIGEEFENEEQALEYSLNEYFNSLKAMEDEYVLVNGRKGYVKERTDRSSRNPFVGRFLVEWEDTEEEEEIDLHLDSTRRYQKEKDV